jgi:hypothetical protein
MELLIKTWEQRRKERKWLISCRRSQWWGDGKTWGEYWVPKELSKS